MEESGPHPMSIPVIMVRVKNSTDEGNAEWIHYLQGRIRELEEVCKQQQYMLNAKDNPASAISIQYYTNKEIVWFD